MNIGIERALKYNPMWIVYSNDDMLMKKDIKVMTRELKEYEKNNIMAVFVKNKEVSPLSKISTIGTRTLPWISFNRRKFPTYDLELNILKRFGAEKQFIQGAARHMYRGKETYRNIGSFCVFRADYVRESLPLFDENIVNSVDDIDVALRLKRSKGKIALFRQYTIGNIGGANLGNNDARRLRALSGIIYLNNKLDSLDH